MFLFAAGAIGVPIYLHLAKREAPTQTSFPSLKFLTGSLASGEKSRVPIHWLLLLMRCLAIILLALAFAHPFMPQVSLPNQSMRILLVDDSFSMQASSNKGLEKELAQTLRSASSSDPIMIGLVRDTVLWMSDFSEDPLELRKWLEENQTPNFKSDFRAAIRQASQRLYFQTAEEKQILLFTDGQKLPWQAIDTESFELDPGVELEVKTAGSLDAVQNVCIRDVTIEELTLGGKSEYLLTLEVQNYGDSAVSTMAEVYFKEKKLTEIPISVEAQSVFQSSSKFSASAYQQQYGYVRLNIQDGLEVDNQRYFSINSGGKPIVFAQRNPSAHDYLETALNLGKAGSRCLYYDLNDQERQDDLSKAKLIILYPEGDPINSVVQKQIVDAVENGATLLVAGLFDSAQYPGLATLPIPQGKPDSGVLQLNEVDLSHPIFNIYHLIPSRDLFSLVFNDVIQLQPHESSNVIAAFPGSPAILETPSGSGRILSLAFTLNNKRTNWPTQPAFVAFAQSTLAYATGERAQSIHHVIDTMPFEQQSIQKVRNLHEDRVQPLSDGLFYPKYPGNFMVSTPLKDYLISVNLPSEESNLASLDTEIAFRSKADVRPAGAPNAAVAQIQMSPDSEFNYELTKWLFMGACLLLVFEFILADRARSRMGTG